MRQFTTLCAVLLRRPFFQWRSPPVRDAKNSARGLQWETSDPLPFRERDLDQEAEDYIVSWARELPRHAAIRIQVHMPAAEASGEHARVLGQAVSHYFGYRAIVTSNELKELFRIGRYSLLIGLAVLGICVASGSFMMRSHPGGPFGSVLNEGFLILGWIANWRLIEIFLYDWWPIVRRRNLFRRLATAEVIVSIR